MPSVTSSQRQSRRWREHRSGSSLSSWEGMPVVTRKTGHGMSNLTIELPSSSMQTFVSRKDEDRYSLADNPEDQLLDEGAAELWLTSPRIASRRKERRDLFAASAAALRRSTYENYEGPAHRCLDARSSVSSPGTSGIRERVQRDILKEEFHKRMQRNGVLLEVETNAVDDVTQQEQPKQNQQQSKQQSKQQTKQQQQQTKQQQQQTKQQQQQTKQAQSKQQPKQEQEHQQLETNKEANTKEKRAMSRSTSERQVDSRSPIRKLSSLAPTERSKDPSLTREQAKPPTTPTPNSKRKKPTSQEEAVLLRLSRQVRLGRRGELPYFLQRRTNRLILHVYDLIAKETIVLLPFGCDFPIGKVFNVLNSGLHSLGTGAYHVGVEVNGTEYAYGANNIEGSSGVFSCVPKCSPGYQYRTSIDLGERELRRRCWVNVPTIEKDTNGVVKEVANVSNYREVETFVEGRTLIKEMASEYLGKDYDLLRKNCCTFAMDVCRRMGVEEEEVPYWFRNLADAGAKTTDVALSTFEPIQLMLSSCDNCSGENIIQGEGDFGFEVIAKRKNGGEVEVVKVVEADDTSQRDDGSSSLGVRRTLSWTY